MYLCSWAQEVRQPWATVPVLSPRTRRYLRYTFFLAPVMWCCRFAAWIFKEFFSGGKPRKRLQFSLSNNSWLYLLQETFKCRQNCTFRYIRCLMSGSVRGPCIAQDPSCLPAFCMLPPSPEHESLTDSLSLFFSSLPKGAN